MAALLAAAVSLAAAGPALGPLYPVAEPDLLGQIEGAVEQARADGTIDREMELARERAAAYVTRPPPVAGLQTATESASRLFDPTVRLQRPVVDAAGEVVHPAGAVVNPLEHVSLRGRLLFLDARDPAQTAYAQSLGAAGGAVRVVLVGGAPGAFHRATGMSTYFDQRGSITRRLGITAVPAVVSQEGLALRIDSVALTEAGAPR